MRARALLPLIVLASTSFLSQGFAGPFANRLRMAARFTPPAPTCNVTLTYANNTFYNLNLYDKAKDAGWNGICALTLTVVIESTATIGSIDPTLPSLLIPSGFPAGSTITVSNAGKIIGAGGAGGEGGVTLGMSDPTPGGNGGDALWISYPTTLNNSGTIFGGGGGGGGGGAGEWAFNGNAGGGGGGVMPGAGGSGASSGTSTSGGDGAPDGTHGAGSTTQGGDGSDGWDDDEGDGWGGGGGGGGPGYAGGAGGAGGAAGGAAGWSIVGTDLIQVGSSLAGVVGVSQTSLPPASIAVFSGNNQSDYIGKTVSFTAIVKDYSGNAVSGARVDWSITSGTGTLAGAVNTSDGQGHATNSFTFGNAAGPVTIKATLHGAFGTPVYTTFTLTGLAISISIANGDGQSGYLTTALPINPRVLIKDGNNNPISGLQVDWSISNSYRLTLAQTSSTTDVNGFASIGASFGELAGAVSLSAGIHDCAAVTGTTYVVFNETALDLTISANSGDLQTGATSSTLAPFVAVVKNSSNAPVSGITIDWTITSGTGTLSTASSTTDANGLASSTLTLPASASYVKVAAKIHGTSAKTYNFQAGTPGLVWAARTMPSSQSWNSITYGNGVFVAVTGSNNSFSNVVAVSADGINWTQYANLPVAQNWQSVTFGNGIFVAVAAGKMTATVAPTNIAATSVDGITWTQQTLPSNQYWRAVAYGGGKFVTVSGSAIAGASNVAAYSADGVTWTAATLPSGRGWVALGYGGGMFATASETGGYLATSPDGITWTARGSTGSAFKGMSYGNGRFIASDTNGSLYSSTDGISWGAAASPAIGSSSPVIYANGLFVVVGYGASKTSPDGVNWTSSPSTYSYGSGPYALAYGNGRYVCTGSVGTTSATSP